MQQWNKSALLGCAMIALSLLITGGILGNTIAQNLGRAASNVPSYIEVGNSRYTPPAEYMFEYEAAEYCRIDYDSFDKLLKEGELEGVYAEIPVVKTIPDEEPNSENDPLSAIVTIPPTTSTVSGVERVFIKAKLDEWMLSRVRS